MANVAKVAIEWRTQAVTTDEAVLRSVCTFHVKPVSADDEITDGDLADFCRAVWDWWSISLGHLDLVREAFSILTHLVNVSAYRVRPALSAPIVDAREPISGMDTQDKPCPPQCAVGLTLMTAEDSRAGRGRMYFPAPPTSWADGIGAHVGAGQTKPGEWGAHLAARIQLVKGPFGPFVLAVFSREHDIAHAVTHFRVASHLVTQRRRRIMPRTYVDVALSGP